MGGYSYVGPLCMRNLRVALFEMPCNVCWRNSNCTGPADNDLKLFNMLKQLQKCIHRVLGQGMRIGAILFSHFLIVLP